MKKEKIDRQLTVKLRKLTAREGAELFGTASPQSLSGAPEGFRPQDLMADCRSVIVVGKRLSDATVETTPSRMFDTLYFAVNGFIDQLILRITDTLIREGYQAVGVGPHSLDGKQLKGDISQKHAAVAAGLGRFGLQSLVLTPQFGPRQRWGTVITDAPLKTARPLEENPCRPETCGGICHTSCPAKVFSPRETGAISDPSFLPGGLWFYWNVDRFACSAYRAGRKKELGWVTEGGHACAICLKVCPVGKRN